MNEKRKCVKCEETKLITEFYKNSAYKFAGGIMTICKKCWGIYHASWCRKNRNKVAKWGHDRKQKQMKEHFFKWRSANWNNRNKANTTSLELWSIWKNQRGRCALSGRKLGRDAQLDHIIPRSQGGSSEINNLRWLSPMANSILKTYTDQEFISFCKDVIELNTTNPPVKFGSLVEVELLP